MSFRAPDRPPHDMHRAPEHIVHANGVDLCVQSFGDRDDPAILLIAGGASSMLHWADEFCERLAAGPRFVIRYDHRDTGRSVTYPPGAPQYTGRDLADDAIGVLDAFGVAAAHIVGISMGGGIAQVLGIRHADRVASLTLISTSPIDGGTDLPPMSEDDAAESAAASEPDAAESAAVSEPDWSDRAAVIDYLVEQERLCTSRSRPVAEEFIRDLATRTVDRAVGIASINNHFMAASGDDSTREQLTRIAVPTLVVHGTEDPMFPVAHGAALAGDIPGARLLTLEHTGHELPPAVWDTVLPAILKHTEVESPQHS
jgi:pimeloyl-ACP methyl ester carboxylesterase